MPTIKLHEDPDGLVAEPAGPVEEHCWGLNIHAATNRTRNAEGEIVRSTDFARVGPPFTDEAGTPFATRIIAGDGLVEIGV